MSQFYKQLYFIFLLFFPLFIGQTSATHKKKLPNILIILTDDQGYGDLSSYGATDLQTPHMDALVAAGMRFTNFYANSPVCSPTRAALLSGRYPEMVGVPGVIRTHADDSWGFLDPSVQLLPNVLKKHNYHTALVGKWHLGLEKPNLPNDRGFDHFHGFAGDMMDDYYTHLRHTNNYMRLNTKEITPTGHATDLFTTWSIDYIKERAKSKTPFFLYLAYNAPHDPVQPPQEWLEKVKTRQPGIDEKRAKLVALIEHLDYGIGQVIQALQETGTYENTIIFFTSDNGGRLDLGANNGSLRAGKGTVYEGGIKVPACVVWPNTIKAGTQSDHRAITMDIYPTILEAISAQAPHSLDSKSFLPQLLGKEGAAEERPFFFIRREGGIPYRGKTIEAVRVGDWKLLQNSPFEAKEFYNLKEDPLEKNNLAPEQSRTFRKIDELLQEHIRQSGAVPWQKPN